MFDRRALRAFRNTLTVAAQATHAESAALLRRTANMERLRVLRQQKQRSGHTPTDMVIADSRRGAPIEQAERQVIIEYGYLREVASEVLRALRARSPRKSGTYARSFLVMIEGQEVANIGAIRHDTAEIVILNTSPYARRLEVGTRPDGRPFVIQVKPRIVEETAILARSRFGNMAKLSFGYFDLASGYTLRRSAGRARGRRSGAAIRYPGIRITAL
jgi:hypothetical protein